MVSLAMESRRSSWEHPALAVDSDALRSFRCNFLSDCALRLSVTRSSPREHHRELWLSSVVVQLLSRSRAALAPHWYVYTRCELRLNSVCFGQLVVHLGFVSVEILVVWWSGFLEATKKCCGGRGCCVRLFGEWLIGDGGRSQWGGEWASVAHLCRVGGSRNWIGVLAGGGRRLMWLLEFRETSMLWCGTALLCQLYCVESGALPSAGLAVCCCGGRICVTLLGANDLANLFQCFDEVLLICVALEEVVCALVSCFNCTSFLTLLPLNIYTFEEFHSLFTLSQWTQFAPNWGCRVALIDGVTFLRRT